MVQSEENKILSSSSLNAYCPFCAVGETGSEEIYSGVNKGCLMIHINKRMKVKFLWRSLMLCFFAHLFMHFILACSLWINY